MRFASRCAIALGVGCLCLARVGAQAQGYRLRLDSRAQRASYRGVMADSILGAQAVTGPTGGFETPDGFAVRCHVRAPTASTSARGRNWTGRTVVSSADLTLWGFGIRGLSLRLNGRVGVDLGASDVWPGIEPAVQLIEAYAEYAQPVFTVRAGRQLLANRLGTLGFDGGKVTLRPGRLGLEAVVYAGLGLARATAIPGDEPGPQSARRLPTQQPPDPGRRRGRLQRAEIDVRADYQRELDGDTRNFVSERAALSLDLRPLPHWSLESGVDYDLANTWFGNADAVVRYTSPWITVAGGLRQYRPHFDLWTIWGAFTPVPYHAGNIASGCARFAGSSCEGGGRATRTPRRRPRLRWSRSTTTAGVWARA